MDIEGVNALVAGGASGLGAATARRLHEAGANVTIADLNPERGSALAEELGASFVAADVTDAEQVEAAVREAAGEDGLRISVCCAGIGWAEKVAGSRGPHAFEPFDTVIRVNLIGTFNVLRLASAAMLANEPDGQGERGVCISTASIAAYDGQIGQIAYSASKGGIVGMTLPAARDLAQSGIRVCAIAPGLFDTPLLAGLPEEARNALGGQVPFPPRLGRPDEYAALAVHIVENTMLNGEVIRLDGALRMPPRRPASGSDQDAHDRRSRRAIGSRACCGRRGPVPCGGPKRPATDRLPPDDKKHPPQNRNPISTQVGSRSASDSQVAGARRAIHDFLRLSCHRLETSTQFGRSAATRRFATGVRRRPRHRLERPIASDSALQFAKDSQSGATRRSLRLYGTYSASAPRTIPDTNPRGEPVRRRSRTPRPRKCRAGRRPGQAATSTPRLP